MKKIAGLLVLAASLTLASVDADAARRFGGGGNLGKQRPAPTMKEATPSGAPAAPTQAGKPAQPAPAPTAAPAPQPKPGFMSRFGGLIAGLGLGALLGSMFGGNMGAMGGVFMLVILGLVLFMAYRAFASRRAAHFEAAGDGAPAARPAFSGIGSAVPGAEPATPASTPYTPAASSPLPADFNRDAFLRVAKTSFIRLQAANDVKDLDDIRDYTTPEMYAEISMQLAERGEQAQKTEIVSLEAQLHDYAVEGEYEIASVRFYGLLRETPQGNPEPFDEIWHVRKKQGDARASWLIAGIQQAE